MEKLIWLIFVMGLGLVAATGKAVIDFDASQAAKDLLAIRAEGGLR